MRAFTAPGPLPAGGAAGIVALSLGGCVGAKALRISGHASAAERLTAWANQAAPLYQADCEAFTQILTTARAARQAAKDSQPSAEHTAATQAAWQKATAIPVGSVRLAQQMLDELERYQGQIKASVRADHQAAITLIQAALRIATENAHDNAAHLAPDVARKLLGRLREG